MKYKVVNCGSPVKQDHGKDKSLSLLAGGIAYDINTKLASILGNIDLALAGPAPQNISRVLDEARKAVAAKIKTRRKSRSYCRAGWFIWIN